jgi:WD40 repeat protein
VKKYDLSMGGAFSTVTIQDEQLSLIRSTMRAAWQKKFFDEALSEQFQLYIPATVGVAESVEGEDRRDADSEVKSFLDGNKRLMLLLGDSGAGKSLFAQRFVTQAFDELTSLPVFIHLPLQKIKSGFFERYLRKQLDLLPEQISYLKNNKIKLCLILDAYDELSAEDRGINIYRIGCLYDWNIKVIIICRTDALVAYSATDHQTIFSPVEQQFPAFFPPFEKRYMQKFDTKQIPLYIQQWSGANKKLFRADINYLDILNRLPGVAEMITNPFALSMILSVLPELLAHAEQKSTSRLESYHLTRLALFDKYTEAWFERQKRKLVRNIQIDDIWARTIVADYRLYCELLANQMWQMNINRIKYIPRQGDSLSVVSSLNSRDISLTVWDKFLADDSYIEGDKNKPFSILRQCGFLREFDGKNYEFKHRSIFIYFASKRVFTSAMNMASIALGKEINAKLMKDEPEQIARGVDMLIETPEFEQVLRDIIDESKHEPRISYAAANAITILAAANKSFMGNDLRHIRIKGANLTGANFDGADLQEADLRKVNLSSAWFANAKLTGSCFDGANTLELPPDRFESGVDACAFSPHGNHYAVLTKGNLSVYESSSHKRIGLYPFTFDKKVVPQGLQFVDFIAADTLRIVAADGVNTKFSFPGGGILGQWRHKPTTCPPVLNRDRSWTLESNAYMIVRRNTATGEVIANWTFDESHTTALMSLALSPDDSWAVSGSSVGVIKRWDTLTGLCTATWENQAKPIDALVISGNGRYVYSGCWDGSIKRWDAKTGRCELTWQWRNCLIYQLLLTPDEGSIFARSIDGTITLWDVDTGRCLYSWEAHAVAIAGMAISPDGSWLLTVSLDQTIRRWNMAMLLNMSNRKAKAAAVNALELSDDGTWALTSHSFSDLSIHRWNIPSGHCERSWRFPALKEANLTTITFNNKRNFVFMGTANGELLLLDMASGAVRTYSGHNAVAELPSFTAEQKLVLQTNDPAFYQGMAINWQKYSSIVSTIIISSDMRWVFSGGWNRMIIAWDFENGFEDLNKNILRGHSDKITALALTPDQSKVLSCSADKTIRVWDVHSGRCVMVCSGHAQSINVLVCVNNNFALSASLDFKIKYWNIATGQCVATWHKHSDKINKLAVSPDGNWAISADVLGHLVVWQLSTGKAHSLLDNMPVIGALKWCTADPTLVMMGMMNGIVSAWTFMPESGRLHLRWRSAPWGFSANQCELLSAYGLPFAQQKLFEQNGAIVQLSNKSSKNIIENRKLKIPYAANQPHKSIFDNSMLVHPLGWVITLARKRTGEGSQHVFMILESVEDNYYTIRRIEFLLELRRAALPSRTSEPRETNIFGQGLIEIAEKSVEDTKILAEQCVFKPSGITSHEGTLLLKNIFNDQSKRIGYSTPGASALYRMFRIPEAAEQHNCLSWCEKQLDAIGVSLTEKDWRDAIVNYPARKLKDNDEDRTSGEKCLLM